nr:MAG TPA: hypothetical protein [Caudoviricetes sp.]
MYTGREVVHCSNTFAFARHKINKTFSILITFY